MNEFNFLLLAFEHWQVLVMCSVSSVFLTYLLIRKTIFAGIFDPFFLIFVANYGVNYSVILFLAYLGEVNYFYVALVYIYGAAMLFALKIKLRAKNPGVAYNYIKGITPVGYDRMFFVIALLGYTALAILIVSSAGLGILAETNRFDAAKGNGSIIRLMDCLAPFIVSYWTTIIIKKTGTRIAMKLGLVVFIVAASLLNGAKAAMLLHISTVALTIAIVHRKFHLTLLKLILAGGLGVLFAFLALSFNLQKNDVEQVSNSPLAGTNLVVERLVFRIIGSGDTSYLTLPNGVIEYIQTDNALTRFIAPIVGSGNLSNLLGYPVTDYTVGRQALLHFDPTNSIAGGPTSHFDLFGYVYFGVIGGFIFSLLIGYCLGSINKMVRVSKICAMQSFSPHRIALVATLWTRSVQVILEPPIGFAYFFDCLVVFTIIFTICKVLKSGSISPTRIARIL